MAVDMNAKKLNPVIVPPAIHQPPQPTGGTKPQAPKQALVLVPKSLEIAGLPKNLQHPYFRRAIEGVEGSGSAELPAVATIRLGESDVSSPSRTATRKTIAVISAAAAAVLLGLTIAEGTQATPNPTKAVGTGGGAGVLGIVSVVLFATNPKPSED